MKINGTMRVLVLAFFVSALVWLSGCGSEPDPCRALKPVSADFEIYEAQQLEFPNGYKPIDSDTIVTDWVMFNALEENAIYEWTLGDEKINLKSFKRFGFPRNSNVDVSLKVTKNPNITCFPTDDGLDTKTRKIFVSKTYICDSKATGTYEGFNSDAPLSKRIIIVDACAKYPPSVPNSSDLTELRIINLTPNCDNFAFVETFITHKQVWFGYTTECLNPTGLLRVSGAKNDSITIKYTVKKDPNAPISEANIISKKFIGIRK